MQQLFIKGDKKNYQKLVEIEDIAKFESGIVHEVYSTFSLAKDVEWCGRLFVLDMKEEEEEGIGTQIHVQHISPAFVGEIVKIVSTYDGITDTGEIITTFAAYVEDRLIATGKQGQKILLKSKIDKIFRSIKLK
jgi:fluoroacetyl-CoA thioesterase